MSLITLREAIRVKLEEEVDGFAKVYTHGGRFDLDELKRWAKQTPCAVVGLLGIPSFEFDGTQVIGNCEWGAFIVTKDASDLKRDGSAVALVSAIAAVVTPLERWGDDAAHQITAIKASNLYGGKVDQSGIALWAVTWTQGYDINRFDITTLEDFTTYHSTTTPEEVALVTSPAPTDTVTLPAA